MSSRLHQNTLREHSGANPHQGSRTSSCLPRAPPCHPDRLASKRARWLADTRRKGPRARFPLEGKAAWSRKPQTQLLFSSEKAAPQRLGFPKCGCSETLKMPYNVGLSGEATGIAPLRDERAPVHGSTAFYLLNWSGLSRNARPSSASLFAMTFSMVPFPNWSARSRMTTTCSLSLSICTARRSTSFRCSGVS